jgi:ParB family chromosome partitioning protein
MRELHGTKRAPNQTSAASNAWIDVADGVAMYKVVKVSPFRCRVWDQNGRMEEFVTDTSCKDEIESIQAYGQVVPAIGRRIRDDSTHDIEIICGARRLFAARQLNIDLAVQVRELSDREAIVVIDIENRQRRDLSAYEKGRSYARWLASGHFESQDDLARALKTSASQVSRLLKVAKLPSVVVDAFPNPTAICEMWALDLYAKCEDPDTRPQVLARARAFRSQTTRPCAREVFDELMRERAAKAVHQRQRNEVVTGSEGQPVFRIKYQDATIAVLIDKQYISPTSLLRIKQALLEILQDASAQVTVKIENSAAIRHNNHLEGALN